MMRKDPNCLNVIPMAISLAIRFHSMSEFDEEKRSCRRRLSDHNARRRKPNEEAMRFNPAYSSFYGTESLDVLSHSTGVQLSDVLIMPNLARNRLVPSKGARAEIFDQGYKDSLSSNEDAVDLRRALSLLSNNSWGSSELDHPMLSSVSTMPHYGTMHAVPHASPLSSQQYWQANQQSTDPRVHASATKTSNANNHFQEFQIFKPQYERSFLFHPNSYTPTRLCLDSFLKSIKVECKDLMLSSELMRTLKPK